MDETEKAYLSALGFIDFCSQFGGDIHSRILLEELLEGVMNEETVFVFGEPDEEGSSDRDGTSGTNDGAEPAD